MSSQTVYLISGPIGAGKTTLSKTINKKNENCVLINGDALFWPLENIPNITWEKRLQLTWKNILAVTKNYLNDGLNVVIDFVVEDELEWFKTKIAKLNPKIKYVVLLASPDVLRARLQDRDNGLRYLDRSLTLLEKLSNDPNNQKFIIDTSDKSTEQVWEEFIKINNYLT